MPENQFDMLDAEVNKLRQDQQQKLQESNELVGQSRPDQQPVVTGISDDDFNQLNQMMTEQQQSQQQETDLVPMPQEGQQTELSDADFASVNEQISPTAPQLKSADQAQDEKPLSMVDMLMSIREGGSRAIAGFKHGVQTAGEASMQSTLKVGSLFGAVDESTVKGYTAFATAKQALRQSELKPGSGMGEFMGALLPYMTPSPVGKGGLLKQAGVGMAEMAAKFPAFTFTKEGDSELAEAATGAAIGAVAPAVSGVIQGTKALKNAIMPGKAAAQEQFAKVVTAAGQSADDLTTAMAEGEQAGVKMTSGELLNNPAVLAREGQIVTNPARQAKVIEEMAGRDQTAIKALGKEMNKILPQGIGTAKKELQQTFKELAPKTLAPESVSGVLKDPVVAHQYNQVLKNADWKAAQHGENTLGRLHETVQFISNKIDSAKGAVNKNLVEAKMKLLSVIKKEVPEYGDFLEKSQRVILKNNYVKMLRNELKPLKGSDKISSTQIYNNFFKDNKATRDLTHALTKQGMETGQIKSMIRILNRLNNSKIDKLITKNPEFSSAFNANTGVLGKVSETIGDALKSRYYDELLEIALNPKYAKEILEASRLHDMAPLTNKLMNIITQATPKGIAASQDMGEE